MKEQQEKAMLGNCELTLEEHQFNDKTMTDVVCYVKGKRFVLAPIYLSKKAKAYFYALLTNQEQKV